MSVPKVPVGSIDTSKPFNQDLEEVRQLVYTRPTKEDISYGFETSGLTRFPQTPTILRCHADFKTIYVVWDRQSNNNHIDHYRVQVSDDKMGWRELRFDGKDWGYDPFPEIEEPPEGEDYSPQPQVLLESYTITYSNEIAHTAIPYREDGAVQRLFYRVMAVTKNGDESQWSEPAEGSTYYIGQSDIRTDEFVYQPYGGFNMSEYTPTLGNFQGGTITLGPNSYYGSGDITYSGDATVLEENFYEYSASGSVAFSGSANFSVEGDFVYTGIQGGIDYSGSAYDVATIYYYNIKNIYTSALTIELINADNTAQSYIIPSGSTKKHYGPSNYGTLPGLESEGFIQITGPYQEDL